MEQMSKCSHCGESYFINEFDRHLTIPKLMEEHKLCFTCAFWEYQFILDKGERVHRGVPIVVGKLNNGIVREHMFIPFLCGKNINCTVSPVSNTQPNYKILVFVENEGDTKGKLFTVNNIWQQGRIPQNMFDKFPVNAKIINEKEALKLIARKDTTVPYENDCYNITEKGIISILGEKWRDAYDI